MCIHAEFTSFWAVTSGQAAAVVSGGMMDLDVVTVSDNNRFMVLFSDITNKGAITAAVGEVWCHIYLFARDAVYYFVSESCYIKAFILIKAFRLFRVNYRI